MTNNERIGMSFVVLFLVGWTFILWAAANKRTDSLESGVRRLTARSTTPATTSTSTTSPLTTEVQHLQRQVLQLQANRGLTGPEVRELVETLLPAETCLEPPCAPSPTAPPAPASTAPVPTTEQQRRRR